ncbi:glycine zipper domain-containing protein [Pelomonas sp. SE-A7]|uniref:glycine zipper domain-containing protein n=1 Tax=Pelomonas sp. SE-A7 TaxID=3054953 RepID=UPI00259D0D74|nr:glycine zipper domain-containing protein [Pelomonas sp. SE-A7]MDM4766376.1 glycine zipper 2TM domain-containing protein [Pelomonas sp. SE-A7]
MRTLFTAAAVASALLLGACSTTNPDVIQRGDAQRMSQVVDATVLSVRPVVVDGSQSGIGGAAGAVTGAIAGSSVGGRREGQVVGVIGAVVGAVVGNAIERSATREDAVEILLQLRNGERRSVVQAKGEENFAAGEPVILVTTGGKTRVSRAPVVQQSAAKPASAAQ